ncbi:hypothetical protein B0T14DRAFT_602994 [Immersiella caudata]|uniref:Velvet domain-containing protein n=1 Tax=Immersiella caudata TaxID=314043 RepID=A0AA39WPB4_9PEZI|nr:hypothetical protein B0T14DRAFT_602994 [Immersiella caudata]
MANCSIWDEEGRRDMSTMLKSSRDYPCELLLLVGKTIANLPFVGVDGNGEEGIYFCFPDLRCHISGPFCLMFSLIVIDPTPVVGRKGDSTAVAAAMSEPFRVYSSSKDYRGKQASENTAGRVPSRPRLSAWQSQEGIGRPEDTSSSHVTPTTCSHASSSTTATSGSHAACEHARQYHKFIASRRTEVAEEVIRSHDLLPEINNQSTRAVRAMAQLQDFAEEVFKLAAEKLSQDRVSQR